MRFVYAVSAGALFSLHFLIACIGVFGWLFPKYELLYVLTLIGVLVSLVFFKSCPFTIWEFALHKKMYPSAVYEYGYISYYVHRVTRVHLADTFVRTWGIIFIGASLFIYLVFH
ncbi:MAG: DUF2784 family protein [Patescibacteria group bacterium]